MEQKEQATRGISELAAALDQVTKTTEQVEAAVADRSTNASVLDAQLAVIGEPIARVDEIIGGVERLSAQPLNADQTTQVVAMGDNARNVRERLLAAKQTIEAWLTLHHDYDHAKQSMTSRVTDLEAETAAIDAKYQQTRPLAEAVEDSHTIQSLLTTVQDERTHVGAVQDIATRLDGRFETANETASFANRVERLDAHLTVSYLAICNSAYDTYALQDLLSKLNAETEAEGALLNEHNSTLTDLNAIGGDVVGVSRAPVQSPADADRKAADLTKIREQLDALLPRIDRSWDRPAKLVERTRTSDLAAQRDQLLAAVDEASRELATSSQLVTVTVTIETETETLRGRLNELETAQHDVSLDEQQRQLERAGGEARRARKSTRADSRRTRRRRVATQGRMGPFSADRLAEATRPLSARQAGRTGCARLAQNDTARRTRRH